MDPRPQRSTGPQPNIDATQLMGASAGAILKDRYRIVRELSLGGFGRVFLAHDQQLHDRPVVVKIKLDQSVEDPWFERKFGEEIRALSLIDHPGVVGVLDCGRTADGKPFLVMQYIEGMNLRSAITPEGLPLDRAAAIIRQIGQALGAAHDKNIWHRDLKPENIMLKMDPGGEEHVKLIDFGLATIASLEAKQTRTRVAGSLAYMAPEQITGQPTAATDVYAFGVIAYEIVTGRKPFVAEDPTQLSGLQRSGVRIRPSALRPAIPHGAEKLILQALHYNPNDRPNSARIFGESLSQALMSTSGASGPVSVPGARGRMWALTGALALAVLLTGAGLWIYASRAGSPKQQARDVNSATAPVVAPPAAAAVSKPEPVSKPDSKQDGAVELAFWNSISASDNPQLLRDYLDKYPNGQFAAIAKHKLAALTRSSDKQQSAAETSPRPRQPKLNFRDGLQYVWIPPGTFQMGCSSGDAECDDNERPAHRVRLTRGFWLGTTEVTVEAWGRFAKDTFRGMPPEPMEPRNRNLNPGWSNRKMPISDIKYDDAKAYCTWAGGRLPTEAEWEYAARGGSAGARYGDLELIAWTSDNSGERPMEPADSELRARQGPSSPLLEKYASRMHEVGGKRPNDFGLYDMIGNLHEWVNDWASGTNYRDAPEVDPQGLESGRLHVLRGSNWAISPKFARASNRHLEPGTFWNSRGGCRCAMDALPAAAPGGSHK